MSTVKLADIPEKDIFKIAGIEFIKFPEVNGKTPAVAKDIAFKSRFGNSNNLNESFFVEQLNEFYEKIKAEIGEENIYEFETDLRTLDGLRPYKNFESRISIPTFGFYRDNVGIFDMYKLETWWWLATPESAKPHDEPNWNLCVSPRGFINFNNCIYNGSGVRPFCILKSDIFVSE